MEVRATSDLPAFTLTAVSIFKPPWTEDAGSQISRADHSRQIPSVLPEHIEQHVYFSFILHPSPPAPSRRPIDIFY